MVPPVCQRGQRGACRQGLATTLWSRSRRRRSHRGCQSSRPAEAGLVPRVVGQIPCQPLQMNQGGLGSGIRVQGPQCFPLRPWVTLDLILPCLLKVRAAETRGSAIMGELGEASRHTDPASLRQPALPRKRGGDSWTLTSSRGFNRSEKGVWLKVWRWRAPPPGRIAV